MNVLFVCLNNTSISPLAEGILKDLYQQNNIEFNVESAGFEPYYINNFPETGAIQTASEHHLDISNLHARLFQKDDFNRFDIILAMDTRSYRGAKDLARTTEDLHKIDYFMNVINPGRNETIEDPETLGIETYHSLYLTLKEGCQHIVDNLKIEQSFQMEQFELNLADLKECATRIKPYVHRTPVMTCKVLDDELGCHMFFKCENFQNAGSFKSRGAINAVFSLKESETLNGVATHSSGNHAQALARAASLRGIDAYIVMPENSSKSKIDSVKSYNGKITFCDNSLKSREKNLFYILRDKNATEVHPYNNPKIITGQATVAKELFEETGALDFILAPVGGGGLLSGTALATNLVSPKTSVIGCEPKQADDAFQSFQNKKLIPQTNPDTIADGLRTSLGSLTFPLIMRHVDHIFTAEEESIKKAMRMVWEKMKVIIEPSAALPVACILENKEYFKDKTVGIILSGGNLDLDKVVW